MAAIRLCLVALALLPRSVFGDFGTYDYGFDISNHVKRQIPQPFVVSGETSSGILPRREIRELEQDPDLWTVYILGLSLLQYTDQSSPTSWYGLTGIHGIPHKTWAGVGPTPGNEATGYCTHSSILFLTWHRPYLVLYEQVLYGIVQMIAGLWPEAERDRYVAAAARFRIPYWDWAATPPSGQSVLPLSVGGSPYVDVNGPSGLQRISNPLFSYSFKPLNATAFAQRPWNIWTSTLRSPTTNDNRAQSNNSLVARNFDQNFASISQRLYILFSNYPNYTSFSNNAWIPKTNNSTYDSLESLHDTVHNLAGGGGMGQPNGQGGHMSYIPYSAFDPIFFLHHTNVDRIFAMWQALYPQSWVQPQTAALSSYTTSSGEIQDSVTALTPFFASGDGAFWTSDTVRDHTRFGYTYAELGSGPNVSRRARARANVRKAINRLYGSSSTASLFMKEKNARGLNGGRSKNTGKQRAGQPTDIATLTRSAVFAGDRYREWIVNIRVRKQALTEPFSVHLFLGDVPKDTQKWAFAKNHVGMMGVFASDDVSGMSMGRLDVSGTIPLTTALVNKVQARDLASLEPQDVEKYLNGKLCRRVLGVSGKVYDAATVRGLEMNVVSSVVKAPSTEEELPEWGRMVRHFRLW